MVHLSICVLVQQEPAQLLDSTFTGGTLLCLRVPSKFRDSDLKLILAFSMEMTSDQGREKIPPV